MTDTVATETPIEPVAPVPPSPDATAGLEAAAPQAASVDTQAPATDQGVAAPIELAPAVADASSEVAAPEAPAPGPERVRPEIEHPVGPVRSAVIDCFLDSDETDLSMSQIKVALSNVLPGTVEAAVLRELRSGRIERIAPGSYRLAAPKPVQAPKQPSASPPPTPDEAAVWLSAVEAWFADPETWDRERLGPRPDEAGRRIPADIVARGVDRDRKRRERRRERDAAQARQAEADRQLRNTLLNACHGNYAPGLVADDLAPIKVVLDLVPLDRVLFVIRAKVDKRCFPGNPPLATWRDPKFLRAVAESYCNGVVITSLVDAWSKATAKAPATKAQSLPAAVDMPIGDIDELRSRHDQENAPAGPHVMPGAVSPAMPQQPVERVEASPATPPAPEPENASTAPPPQPDAMPANCPAIGAEPAAVDAKPPAEPTRASILAAFAQDRTPPQPAKPPPPQPRPHRQTEPEPIIDDVWDDDAWDEFCVGFRYGTLKWNRRRLGPEPLEPGCRVPKHVLKRNGLV